MQHHWQVVNRGIDMTINSPEDLWFMACKYFKWCDENPIKSNRKVNVGKDAGKVIEEESTRPYSIKALCLHCGITEEYLRDVRNTKDKGSLYYIVVSRIMYVIYTQNLEHAILGMYNPIFTGKVLRLDTEDNSNAAAVKVEIVTGLPALSDSENSVLEKMDLELREIRGSD